MSVATASRVVKVVLLDAIPPLMLKTPDNPDGSPIETFDEIRAGVARDRSQSYKDLSGPFYGANRPGADVSQGVRDVFRLWSVRYHPPFSCQYGVARSDTRGCPETRGGPVVRCAQRKCKMATPLRRPAPQSGWQPGQPQRLSFRHQRRAGSSCSRGRCAPNQPGQLSGTPAQSC